MSMPHDWRAVPYEESVEKKWHRESRPYAWQCRGCGTVCRTNNEAEPSSSVLSGVGVHYDCNIEIVSQVLKS